MVASGHLCRSVPCRRTSEAVPLVDAEPRDFTGVGERPAGVSVIPDASSGDNTFSTDAHPGLLRPSSQPASTPSPVSAPDRHLGAASTAPTSDRSGCDSGRAARPPMCLPPRDCGTAGSVAFDADATLREGSGDGRSSVWRGFCGTCGSRRQSSRSGAGVCVAPRRAETMSPLVRRVVAVRSTRPRGAVPIADRRVDRSGPFAA